jgi:hypothetical protein
MTFLVLPAQVPLYEIGKTELRQDLVVRKSKRNSKNQARREERGFAQTAFTFFKKATEIKQS